ncbi:MAG: hypothetical protein R3343_03435 [Nitriliruptorales bacterium]|nr:hypothetical protein [Nitriliruptorales bacterium]
MSAEMAGRVPAPARWIRVITLIGGGLFALWGLWALLAPRSFFDALATFEPYNPHFLHDIGAFQLGLGAVLLLAAFPQRIDGLAAALVGVGLGGVAHVTAHVVDADLGGTPETDIPFLGVLALALLIAGVARLRTRDEIAGPQDRDGAPG